MAFTTDTAPATSIAGITTELHSMAAVAVQTAVALGLQFGASVLLAVQVAVVAIFL